MDPITAAHLAGDALDIGIGRIWVAVADIFEHGAGKEKGGLGDDTQVAAVISQIKGADIAVIDQQLAALEFIEARHQFAQARLTGAGMPNQRNRLAGGNRQIKAL